MESAGSDTNAPVVSAVSPTNGAVGVSTNAVVAVTFNEAMNPGTITNGTTITLSNATAGLVSAVVTYNAGTFTATLTPNGPLALTNVYTVRVKGGAGVGVADVATNYLASDFTASFTTEAPDLTLPVVISVSPTNGAAGVSLSASVAVTFSEAMDPATITNGTVTLSNASGVVSSTAAYYGSTNTAVLTPNSPLAFLTTYTVTVAGGAGGVRDVAGNALLNVFTATFTTTDQVGYSLWDNSYTPANPSVTDGQPITLGVKFQSQIDGYIVGLRFYKGANNTNTHVGNLWTVGGGNLATHLIS